MIKMTKKWIWSKLRRVCNTLPTGIKDWAPQGWRKSWIKKMPPVCSKMRSMKVCFVWKQPNSVIQLRILHHSIRTHTIYQTSSIIYRKKLRKSPKSRLKAWPAPNTASITQWANLTTEAGLKAASVIRARTITAQDLHLFTTSSNNSQWTLWRIFLDSTWISTRL